MKIKHVFWIAIVTLTTFVSCHRDIDDDFSEEVSTTFQPIVYQEITGSIIGFVYDEAYLPVADAQVSIYSTTTKTDEHGIFYIKNAKMDRQGTYLKVVKNGYFLGSDIVYPLEEGAAYTRVKMLKLDNALNFSAAVGGEIAIPEGGKVIFPAGAIANADGTPYQGQVLVSARFLNPNHPDMGDMMPGGLMADGANGNTYVLATLGMAAIELHDPSGKSLNILKGKEATLELPAVTGYQGNEVPFWYFDEAKGRWQEEGVAVLQGNKFVAQVKHFSFWNLDVPYPLIQLCGKVTYENGYPAQNVNVRIDVDGLGTRFGYIDENGMFCGKVPKDVRLKISILSNVCNKTLAETTIGPLKDDTQMNTIIVDKVDIYSIAGKITCQGSAPLSGVVVLRANNRLYPFATDENGNFNINISGLVCNTSDQVSVFGFDNASHNASNEIVLPNKINTNLELEICDTGCPLDGQITYDCDETISVQITRGSGQYTYQWENSATTASIHVSTFDLFNPKTYCVTVTDLVNNCSKTFCNLFAKPELGIESNCQDGIIYAYPQGGQQPYTILWSNGKTDQELHVTQAGTYCITLTDNLGCSVEKCVEFNPVTMNTTPISCSNQTYRFDSSPFSTGNYYPQGANGGRITYPIEINIFETGFIFDIFIGNDHCSFYDRITLPRLINGLKATPTHTTCSGCSDGKIQIELINGATCENCVAGSTRVYKTDNLNTDLSSINNNGNLSAGNYYVVVVDNNTNCFIAFEKVTIN